MCLLFSFCLEGSAWIKSADRVHRVGEWMVCGHWPTPIRISSCIRGPIRDWKICDIMLSYYSAKKTLPSQFRIKKFLNRN